MKCKKLLCNDLLIEIIKLKKHNRNILEKNKTEGKFDLYFPHVLF